MEGGDRCFVAWENLEPGADCLQIKGCPFNRQKKYFLRIHESLEYHSSKSGGSGF